MLKSIGHPIFESSTPEFYPKIIRSKCKIRCEMEQLKVDNGFGDRFNFEQLHGWNEFRKDLKVSGVTWSALKIAHRRTFTMFQILFLDQCYPMETWGFKVFYSFVEGLPISLIKILLI